MNLDREIWFAKWAILTIEGWISPQHVVVGGWKFYHSLSIIGPTYPENFIKLAWTTDLEFRLRDWKTVFWEKTKTIFHFIRKTHIFQ